MGLKICTACLMEELQDKHDTGSRPGDCYVIAEAQECESQRHQHDRECLKNCADWNTLTGEYCPCECHD